MLRIKARGQRDLVTAVGHAAISAGEWITASGEWTNDRTHGLQFRARYLRASAPSSIEGIEKYLGSGMIRGIGSVFAKRMVGLFGTDVFDIIEGSPGRLREVDGIGPTRAARITAAWADQKMVREIMVFLYQHGVGTARAVRIFKTFGADAVQVMSENPLPTGPRHPGHRLPYRRPDRGTSRHREDRDDPGARRDLRPFDGSSFPATWRL